VRGRPRLMLNSLSQCRRRNGAPAHLSRGRCGRPPHIDMDKAPHGGNPVPAALDKDLDTLLEALGEGLEDEGFIMGVAPDKALKASKPSSFQRRGASRLTACTACNR
jgi:hypothetical protein